MTYNCDTNAFIPKEVWTQQLYNIQKIMSIDNLTSLRVS